MSKCKSLNQVRFCKLMQIILILIGSYFIAFYNPPFLFLFVFLAYFAIEWFVPNVYKGRKDAHQKNVFLNSVTPFQENKIMTTIEIIFISSVFILKLVLF